MPTFRLGVTGNLCLFEKLLKHTVLQGFRTIEQTAKIVQHEHPLVEHRLQFILCLGELRHFQIEERQLIVEHMIVLDISQLDLMAETVGRILAIGKHEIQHANGIDIVQMVVPLLAFYSLLADGERGVIDAAIFEVLLLRFLHLNDETAAVARHAVHIEHGATVTIALAKVLGIQVLYIGNLLFLAIEQGIEETDEQVLVHFCTEEFLETEIGIRIDVAACVHFAVSVLFSNLFLHNSSI